MLNLKTLFTQILYLLAFLVGSFVLIHVFALFGLFLALALPLLHLFFYPHVISFYSRFRHIPHRFIHSFIDSFALILLSLTSLGLVYGEYRLLTHFIKPTTPPLIATLSIPTRNQYQVGETFPLPLALDNIPTSINVFQADLSFNPALLEVVSLDTHNTFAKFFVQQEYDNDKGYLRVSGGIPNPGYSQPSGLLSTAYFRVKSAGATELIYLDSSLVLANDGSGTNLLADYPRIPLILTPAESASSQPNALTIRPLVQGDTDTTVLTFSQYTHELPLPYQNVEGTSTTSAPLTPSPTHSPNDFSHPILRLDHFILDLYQSLFSYLSL